ncbi:MAG: alpha-2-macroglobulin family protein [Alphaproteobacteria bacterium]|nr:alpha-2-macroglobulin family protein [Alphaproteobacteria bacterium]
MNRTTLVALFTAVALGAGVIGYTIGNEKAPLDRPAPAPIAAPAMPPAPAPAPTPAQPPQQQAAPKPASPPVATPPAPAPQPAPAPAPAPQASPKPAPPPVPRPFAVTRTTISADRGAPEACLHFSQMLDDTGRVKYADFIAIEPETKAAVTVTREALCLGGLSYGVDYTVTVKVGLPAANGAKVLAEDKVDVAFGERPPVVSFAGKGYILPRQSSAGLPVTTINISKVNIALYRIGERLLPRLSKSAFSDSSDDEDVSDRKVMTPWNLNTFRDSQGALVWTGSMEVRNVQNTSVTTAIPIREMVKDYKPGAYVVVAWNAADGSLEQILSDDNDQRYEQRFAAQWLFDSDIGITSFNARDGLTIFVRSLHTAQPLAGIELSLIARNNDELARMTTDASGKVVFPGGLLAGTGAIEPISLMAFDKSHSDFNHLDLTKAAFDFSDRGVEGRATPGPVDGYIYTDRGIYRPGETVNVMALMRDSAGNAVEGVPVTMIVRRPDGVEFRRQALQAQGAGGLHFPVELTRSARRGKWSVAAYLDPKADPVSRVEFSVEDFIPQKLKVQISTSNTVLKAATTFQVDVAADFLYGAPAAGLEGEAELTVKADANPFPKEPGFRFGDVDERINPDLEKLELAAMDERGRATIRTTVTLKEVPMAPMMGELRVSVLEPGGRATGDQLTIPVRLRNLYIGAKPLFSGASAEEGREAGFEIITLNPDGARIAAKGVEWRLVKENRRFQWYRDDNNNWRWREYATDVVVAQGTLDIEEGKSATIRHPVQWGGYRLILTDGENRTVYRFYAGWGAEVSKKDTPDTAAVSADKTAYAPGDVAKLRVEAPFDGEALLVVANDRIVESRLIQVAAAGTTIEVPVKADWGAGAYALVTAYRPLNRVERAPVRAVGLAWLGIDPGTRSLQVSVDAPERIRPRTSVTLPVKVANAGGNEVFVTLAAVDEGILQLTRFRSPKPVEYYFGKRMLGVYMRDDYGKLLDDKADSVGRLREGGDAAGGVGLEVVPIKVVSLFSGIVKVGADGIAQIKFDVPDFSGQLRLMAVAYDKSRVGSTEGRMFVRDALTSDLVLPRFLAPGDRSQATISLHNVEGQAGEYTVKVSTTGSIVLTGEDTRVVTLAAGRREQFVVPVAGDQVGLGSVTMAITGPGNFSVTRTWDIETRAPQAPVTRQSMEQIASGSELRIDRELLSGFLPGTASASVALSSTRTFDVAALLQSLDRYPYGCLEQTTSRALPLLYFNDVAWLGGIKEDKAIPRRIQEAVYSILDRQMLDGGFGMWSVYSGPADQWLQVYSIDFLLRARDKNYVVPEAQLRRSLQWMQRYAPQMAPNAQAYAWYLLGRAGLSDAGRVRYFQDTSTDKMTGALSHAHLAAALSLVGERGRAEAAFKIALDNVGKRPDYDYYGTPLRDVAALVALAPEIGQRAQAQRLTTQLAAQTRISVQNTTTQEKAWMLLASAAELQGASPLDLIVDGKEVKPNASTVAYNVDAAGLARGFTIKNVASGHAWAMVSARGVPAQPLPADGKDVIIEREFRTLDGGMADLSRVRQNDRIVVMIDITSTTQVYHEMALLDLLPAGFEIESVLTEEYRWMAKLGKPSSTEARDDRFFAAFEFGSRDWPQGWRPWWYDESTKRGRLMRVAYVVRAITPGSYVLPASQVEDMYNPEVFARTSAQRVTILTR